MRDRFLIQTCHEAYAPLNTIIGTAFLLQRTPLEEQQYQHLLKIIESSKVLLQNVQNMLDSLNTHRTAFETDIPLSSPPSSSPPLQGNTFPIVQAVEPRVLLVEDNEINQEIALEIIQSAHLDTDVVGNGQEAVDAVKKAVADEKPYSLILMDVQMPVMDGLEATKHLRAVGYSMPIIAMTAHTEQKDRDRAFEAGMNAYLNKPLDPIELFATFAQWLLLSPAKKNVLTKTVQAVNRAQTPQEEAQARQKILPRRLMGFNMRAGLATVGGNEELYKALLIKFAYRYATINEDISNSLQNKDLEAAVRLAHTVRGIAANLGAEDLAKSAELLEKSIINEPNSVAPYLETLVELLSEAIHSIKQDLDDDTVIDTKRVLVPLRDRINAAQIEPTCQVLHADIVNMELDWGRASDTVEILLYTLQNTALESVIVQLKCAVEDFDSQEAQKVCNTLQELLRSS